MRVYLFLILFFLNSCKVRVNKVFPFGIQENGVRTKLKIPIIEDGMIDRMEYLKYAGNRWELKNQFPEKVGNPVHIVKIVTLSKCDTCSIRDEIDAYRKKEADGSFSQFDIFTKFISRYEVHRTGRYTKYGDKSQGPYIHLGEVGIDSICKSWGLNELIKGIDNNIDY